MRAELRNVRRHRLGRAEVNLAQRPTRVTTTDTDREVFLSWDGAVDDAGQLRRCLACGCSDLFQEKAFPQVTGLVVVLAFAGAFAGIFGLVTNIPLLTFMVVVLIADVSILLFARKRLVCYRCRSSYHQLAIAPYHRRWDRTVAERHVVKPHEPEAPDRNGDETGRLHPQDVSAPPPSRIGIESPRRSRAFTHLLAAVGR